MQRRSPLAVTWALATIAGATVVGVTTKQPGFVVITFLGGLVLPRVLGFGPRHHHHGFGHHGFACGRGGAGAGPGSDETASVQA